MFIITTALRELVEQAAHDANLDPATDLRFNYSGRFMYNRECLALVGTIGDLVRFVVALTRAVDATYEDGDGPEASDLHDVGLELLDAAIHDTRQDSMGLSLVFYWPRVTVEA